MGKRGFDSAQERRTVAGSFMAAPTLTPRAAFRMQALGDPGIGSVTHSKCKMVKRSIKQQAGAIQSLGDLRAFMASHSAVPADQSKPYFCVAIARKDDGKPFVSVMATTLLLQRRWADISAAGLSACADSGYKFNVAGWPLTWLAGVNPAGELGVCGIGMTSRMLPAALTKLFSQFQDSSRRTTSRDCSKILLMSDGEDALRDGLRDGVGGANTQNLMCWFHVKKACKQYVWTHGGKDKKTLWAKISKDLDLAHSAQSRPDFLLRCDQIVSAWEQRGGAESTSWTDKGGKNHNFIAYFKEMWVRLKPEWHLHYANPAAPTTNNAMELNVRWSRQDHGRAITSIRDTLQFLLDQAEFETQREFDARKSRSPPLEQWRKAQAFLPLLGTPAVRCVEVRGKMWHVCSARSEGAATMDERPPLSEAAARKAATTVFKVLQAERVPATEFFSTFDSFRVFGDFQGTTYCSCPAYAANLRLCHHALALDVHQTARTMPENLDGAPLAVSFRGRPPQAGDRYAFDRHSEAQQLEIERLTTLLAANGMASAVPKAVSKRPAASAAQLKRPAALSAALSKAASKRPVASAD